MVIAPNESMSSHIPCGHASLPPDDPMSIFVDGKLKPGTYKVQNLASQTYLEVLEPSKELCCRPASVLSPKDALVAQNLLLPSLERPQRSDGPIFIVGIPTVRVRVQDQKGA